MNIDEAIKILTENDISDFYFDHSECCDFSDENNYRQAVETLINEYQDLKDLSNELQIRYTIENMKYKDLKEIEEAHRIENGELREEIKTKDEYIDAFKTTWRLL